ncbi:HAD-IA family hydrolase [Tepidiforma sp.]|uniref:HAD family hydrolase n=1 Tax=Tepidiforma sp. TaxID=2682230 RepID=UPI002ADE1894|nr:HAD-IA family hydrolase [Tepidiforma sp.]
MTAILWDLDDTLLETLPARMEALAHAHERVLGTPIDPVALWRANRGGTLEALARRLCGENYLAFTAAYRDYYYALPGRARPFPGIEAALRTLHAAGVPMAIVTSKVSWGATEELEAAGLLQYFHAVIGFDDTEQHKPDPEPVYAALDRLLIDHPTRVTLVGDSPADIWAARNAGIRSVAALWGTIDAPALLDALPDATARTPGEVLQLIAEAGGRDR